MDGAAVGGVDQTADLLTVEGFALEQTAGHGVEAAAVTGEEFDGPLLLAAQDGLHLGVDHPAVSSE